MANIIDVPFRSIPRQSELFLSYLESSPAALRFFQQAPTMESLENAAKVVLRDSKFPRVQIASILRSQNKSYGCAAATLDRIADLESPDSVAVVTGQQVGLFAGPLYTIFKAMTAVHLADELRSRGINAVPVFWMDSEDHDLAEVTHLTTLNPDSTLEKLDYRGMFPQHPPAYPVGSIQFPETIREVVLDFLSRLPEGDGKPGLKVQLESTCRPGATFTQSFAELMVRVLPGSGLIFFDPQDGEAKQLVSGVFQTALRKENELREALLHRNRELETSGFHAQVSVLENSTVLFLIENGERRVLEKRSDSRFGLKNTERIFTAEEMLDLAVRSPGKFSSNVLLRPLVQDHLFPTIAYVGGSSELAYFAQIEVLYRLYNRPMPVIWPRDSFTLVEPEVGEAMDRLGIEIRDCFQEKLALAQKAIRNSGLSKAAEHLDALQRRLDAALAEIKPEVQAIEPPLAQALETARRKITHNVQLLRSRVVRVEEAQNSSLSAALEMILNNCYPFQTLQERELGIHHFLARHGFPVLEAIRSAMERDGFTHRVIRL
jgi:bacillithiol synthase